ncbi:hypothetical protein EPA93_33420 [Ktedonosporobacter rubrisoli]|uniref:FAD/NAD(P)-binding domain-containing protein n=1 Tax=Ktedonosporobacter rubrisoli TaxID=2509675 RepID=A0A4P6JYP2_KTERU|nr:FAD-dependent oxidoreductase [Ktedonosporobacter rubrisoli]QBD80612.1 hypothetical protein EPA93_33420 [Ktedonosporobacter rubrisoli]
MNSSQDKSLVVSTQQKTGAPYLDSADIVIIGNGIAGLTAAMEARRHAPDKRIVIVTEQIHPTINTPALKQFAIAKLEREQLLAYPAGTEREQRIHVVTAHVKEIHARSKYVTLDGNRAFGYGSLLLATGSTPMGLPAGLPGRNFDGVLTLHRLQDYLDLRRRLNEVSEAAVIGGGAHAIETVMGLLYWGIRVHWLIRGETFMGRILDKPASELVLENVRRAGAVVHTQTEVVGVVGRVGVVAGVITNQQTMIPCQMVLSCTGTRPVDELAERCSLPLKHKNGILVDDQLRSSVNDIYAAGDVAALKNPQTGRYEPRAQWYAAVSQARIAGAMLVGHDELAQQPFGVLWHATHLGELSMLTVGDPMAQGSNIVTLTDKSQGGYRRMAITDNRLIGYLSLGPAQPDSLAIKRIVDEGHPVRDITRALLKGNFDARQHLSQQRSIAAQGMLTAKLPQIATTGKVAAVESPSPQPEKLIAERVARQESGAELRREAVARAQQVAQSNAQSIFYEEELSPFSGNLPAVPGKNTDEFASLMNSGSLLSERTTGEIKPLTGNLPAISTRVTGEMDTFTGKQPAVPEVTTEEISPFTGNLPVISQTTQPQAPVSAKRTQGRGLWAYANQPAEQQTGEQKKEAVKVSIERRPSRNLWSYSQGDPARIEERR